MSTYYYIVPFQPDKWESETSSLSIDPTRLQKELKSQWPDITILTPQQDDLYLLEWQFNHQGGPSYLSGLQRGNQTVSFGLDAYFIEFILWYRKFVQSNFRLFLTCDAYPITRFLELTSDTNEKSINNYLHQN